MIDVTTEQRNSMESESVVVIVIWNESECERVMVQISEERREEREMGGSSGRAYPVVIFVADRERERAVAVWRSHAYRSTSQAGPGRDRSAIPWEARCALVIGALSWRQFWAL